MAAAARIGSRHPTTGSRPPVAGKLRDVVAEAGEVAGGGGVIRDRIFGATVPARDAVPSGRSSQGLPHPLGRSPGAPRRAGAIDRRDAPRSRRSAPGVTDSSPYSSYESAQASRRSDRSDSVKAGRISGRGRLRLHRIRDRRARSRRPVRRGRRARVRSCQAGRDVPVTDQGEEIPLDGDPAVRLACRVLGRARRAPVSHRRRGARRGCASSPPAPSRTIDSPRISAILGRGCESGGTACGFDSVSPLHAPARNSGWRLVLHCVCHPVAKCVNLAEP